jgi:AcrR family transcriptional regulator
MNKPMFWIYRLNPKEFESRIDIIKILWQCLNTRRAPGLKGNNNKKDEILQAASRIIHEQNLSCMTLDAIAKEAKVSKGGLLYHFPNKDSVVRGLIDKGIQSYYKTLESLIEEDSIEEGKWSRAYLSGSFFEPKEIRELWVSGLLSSIAFNKGCLKPLDEGFAQWQSNFENDGINPVAATIIKLVSDGVWFLDLFGFAHLTEEMKKNVYERLLSLSQNE